MGDASLPERTMQVSDAFVGMGTKKILRVLPIAMGMSLYKHRGQTASLGGQQMAIEACLFNAPGKHRLLEYQKGQIAAIMVNSNHEELAIPGKFCLYKFTCI